jgi:general secretion pathway protein J
MRRAAANAGFTLVEALVSLFVFSIIAAGSVMVLVQSVRSQEAVRAVDATVRDLQLTQSLLASDAAQMAPRTVRLPDNSRTPRFSGGRASVAMAFVRAAGAVDPARGALTQVAYVEYQVRGDRLVRRTRSSLDPTPATRMDERVMLRGIANAQIAFFDGATWQAVWTPAQNGAPPRAVAFEADLAGYGRVRIAALVGVS